MAEHLPITTPPWVQSAALLLKTEKYWEPKRQPDYQWTERISYLQLDYVTTAPECRSHSKHYKCI